MDWTDMNADESQAGDPFSSSSSFSTTATPFDRYYLSYPLSHIAKNHLETGNKIIMPPSALDHLASLAVSYPLLFRIESTATGRYTHSGVVEFTADEGFVFLPTWMMDNMQLQEGDLVNVKNTCLPTGKYMKIQPHATKFTTLSDHKSLLEKTFLGIACVTTGDTIVVNHGDEKYLIDIVETKPSPAISLFETDCEVDFAPPLDYKEAVQKTGDVFKGKCAGNEDLKRATGDDEDTKMNECNLFPGVGRRLGGTPLVRDGNCSSSSLSEAMKNLKTNESTAVVDEKQKNRQRTEIKPFTRVGRRVDGQQSAEVPEAEMIEQGDQSNIQVEVKKVDQGFNAFTGKSHRLM